MHSIVTTFRGAVIKVEVANFCAAMDTLIDQDVYSAALIRKWHEVYCHDLEVLSSKPGRVELGGTLLIVSTVRVYCYVLTTLHPVLIHVTVSIGSISCNKIVYEFQ